MLRSRGIDPGFLEEDHTEQFCSRSSQWHRSNSVHRSIRRLNYFRSHCPIHWNIQHSEFDIPIDRWKIPMSSRCLRSRYFESMPRSRLSCRTWSRCRWGRWRGIPMRCRTHYRSFRHRSIPPRPLARLECCRFGVTGRLCRASHIRRIRHSRRSRFRCRSLSSTAIGRSCPSQASRMRRYSFRRSSWWWSCNWNCLARIPRRGCWCWSCCTGPSGESVRCFRITPEQLGDVAGHANEPF
ncbi:unnamed protein product [Tuwongella immobilis]|uniref:Uncharacterized protein n=1 Tax=Tuwongella immobilis TaxID=692036 RepID=A0A6C2YHS1_9BACT|nr:unnamed protein product [Tuwongella immobilis]VTR97036.1 unnamed protein product [Tuwongella immobilis]